jgi:hypothetical protein
MKSIAALSMHGLHEACRWKTPSFISLRDFCITFCITFSIEAVPNKRHNPIDDAELADGPRPSQMFDMLPTARPEWRSLRRCGDEIHND